MFLFVILFGLSGLSRLHPEPDPRGSRPWGCSTDDAVAYGIKSTASVGTSAAIVMVGVFSIFGTLSFLFLKGSASASRPQSIDATIVRAVLLPAAMKLLGDANWYLPKWLDWPPDAAPG